MNLQTRIKIEKRIVRKLVETLINAGFYLRVYDGEEWASVKSNGISYIMQSTFSTDQDEIHAYRRLNDDPNSTEFQKVGKVLLVYGNDGYDVITDYSVALTDVLAPVMAYADNQEETYS